MTNSIQRLSAVLLLLISGCVPLGGYGSARTVGAHHLDAVIEPVVRGVARPGLVDAVDFVLNVNYGVTDKIELGGEASLLSAGMTSKFSLLRASNPDDGFNISLAPRLRASWAIRPSGLQTDGLPVLTAEVPLLMGRRFHGHEVTFGPVLIDDLVVGTGGVVNGLSAGVQTSMLFRVARDVRIGPELMGVYALPPRANDAYAAQRSGPQVQVGLVGAFGP